jgi:hypothetical protein
MKVVKLIQSGWALMPKPPQMVVQVDFVGAAEGFKPLAIDGVQQLPVQAIHFFEEKSTQMHFF